MGWTGIAAIGALAVALGHGAPAQADAAAGKGSFSLCAACHGVDGRGNRELGAPALAGLQPWYVQRQLHNFAAGVRGASERDKAGQQMRPMARTLEGPQAVANVTAYIATLPLRRH